MLQAAKLPRYVYAYAEHIGDRKEQQDRVAVLTHDRYPEVVFAVLADGMGGHTGGAIAAQCVIDAAQQTFENYTPAAGAPETWLQAVIKRAHEAIQAKGEGFDRDPRATIVLMLADENGFHWAHVGDSRLYHIVNGRFVFRTEDHSLVEILLGQGQINENELLTHPERSRLFASLGGDENPNAPFGEALEPKGQDTVLLCSDGLWAYFHRSELATIISYRPLDEACTRLIRLARRRAKASGADGDNISLAIVRVAAPLPSENGGSGLGELLGKLVGKKAPAPVAPSHFEDARRYMRSELYGFFISDGLSPHGAHGKALMQAVNDAHDPAALIATITTCTHAVREAVSEEAALLFSKKALDLLAD